MIDLRNIRPLSDFQRNAKAHIKRLKKTGEPEVLTVNGEAQVVVQDAISYQKLLDQLDDQASLEAIKEGLREADAGQGIPLEEFDRKMRRKYKIPKAS
jgi:PHD/YefM family antitoxin component YafN of YafNO toxin-antitoxin module